MMIPGKTRIFYTYFCLDSIVAWRDLLIYHLLGILFQVTSFNCNILDIYEVQRVRLEETQICAGGNEGEVNSIELYRIV